MCPIGPLSYHSKYIYRRFSLEPHSCVGDCSCVTAGCTYHWRWKDGKPPPMTNGDSGWDYGCVDYQLLYFGAYQGPVSGTMTKQGRFHKNYDSIVEWVRQLNGTTIFCNWDSEVVRDVYERVKDVYAGKTVPATKTLYFFLPELFIILDRKQVWKKWKAECTFLPSKIDSVSGKDCVALLEHVRSKISSAIRRSRAFTLDASPVVRAGSVDQLRLRTPLQLDKPEKIGQTLGKVIDNIIR